MVLVAVRLGGAQFVHRRRRKAADQLEAADMCPVAEVRSRTQSVQSAVLGIERILVAEVIVTHKELVLVVDVPVHPEIEELNVLHRGGGDQLRGRQADGGGVGRRDGHRRRSPA